MWLSSSQGNVYADGAYHLRSTRQAVFGFSASSSPPVAILELPVPSDELPAGGSRDPESSVG